MGTRARGESRRAGQLELFAAREAAVLETRGRVPDVVEAALRPERHPDQDARDRIAQDLDANLLVEAGAGAGKTTEMVTRMLALVRGGRPVERLAAVTFTRKAASELRERFQTRIEAELRAARAPGAESALLDRALRDIDRAFIGTIHSFCARLLRERPLDAGLDPGFRETLASEQVRLTREFWSAHIERLAAEGDASLAELEEVGLAPRQLTRLFELLTRYPDVEFPADPVARPDPAQARAELSELLRETRGHMPEREPAEGWDELQTKVRALSFHQNLGWNDDLRFFDVLAQHFSANVRAGRRERRLVTAKRWPDPHAASQLGRRFEAFASDTGAGGHALILWYAHRYPLAMRFASRAAREFQAERRRRGTLFFEDLLMLSARLLRESAAARDELAARFPHLLVDEFQDTDPLQAEVLFLLATAAAPDQHVTDWRTATPRPGSLFVVGDPKQSIYRFRRADISLYNQVKRRFLEFGQVLELTSNFRSRPPMERFVNDVFKGRFGAEETEHQARFAPLRVRQPPGDRQGVFFYSLTKPADRWPRENELAAQDAERVASWIAAEVASGARGPGDFLVLTRRKKFLDRYAQAIEARNLPVQVTGAGIGIELELRELELLLEALADPGDARLTVAVLIGLFFGLDFEQLTAHVVDERGRPREPAVRFTFTQPPADPRTDVERALATLHRFWELSRREPADVVVARIIDELGLLPLAAAGELADSRAGALLFLLEAVRAAALNGDASLQGALDAIDSALETEEAEAPLVPARRDAVRIMNLHQAKGLEAPVVILAEPFGDREHAPPLHVSRSADGGAIGWCTVTERTGNFVDTTLARPLEWPEHDAEERRFEAAEADRLLYVAATRARDELLVGSYHDDRFSPWAAFFPNLLMEWPRLELPIEAPPERERLEVPAAALREEVERVAERRHALATATREVTSVTRLAKAGADTEDPADGVHGRGPEWGSAVHAALEEAERGTAPAELREVCRALLIGAERPVDARGEPVELDELISIVVAVTGSPLHERAERCRRAGEPLLTEVTFAVPLPSLEAEPSASPQRAPSADPLRVIEGVIDLAFRDEGGWIIVDYKSDAGGRGIPAPRLARYRAQVDLYARCWERLTGEPVRERVLLFTEDGQTVVW